MQTGTQLAVVLLACSLWPASEGARRAEPMLQYKVDLQQPPETRWREILSHYNDSVPLILDYFESLAPKELTTIIEFIMRDVDGYLGELGQEMRGVADYWNIDLGIVVGLNLIYELRRLGGGHPNVTNGTTSAMDPSIVYGCTSIVAQDQSGNVYHGRNLDWNLPDNIRNISIQVEFYDGPKLLFNAVTAAGFVGVLTAVSPHGYSVSINERSLGGNIVEDTLQAVITHSMMPTHLLRKVMGESTSYNDALSRLKKEKIVAPVYYIIAGSERDQGAVLTRDRNKLTNEYVLDSSSSHTNSWYILETNYDLWKPVDPYDNRRYYGNHYMQYMGQQSLTMSAIEQVLSTWPVWNNYTTYTAMMSPAHNTLTGYDVYTE